MTYYVMLDIWWRFTMIFEILIISWAISGGIYMANRDIFGHFSRFGMNIVGIEYSNSIFDPINDFWKTYLDYSYEM